MDKMNKKTNEVRCYFSDYGVIFPEKGGFSFKEFRKEHDLRKKVALVFLCNLEDTGVMQEIADGKYDNFDVSNSNLFNDAYSELIKYI